MANARQSMLLSQEQIGELSELFQTVDIDGNGYINVSELQGALETCGFKLPAYEVRDLIRQYDSKIKDDRLDLEEFKGLYLKLKSEKGMDLRKTISPTKEKVQVHEGLSGISSLGTVHTIRDEERHAFTSWLESNLSDDPDCAAYLPLDPESSTDLYDKCKDGVLLCKMINKSQPDTIDERVINKTKLSVYRIHENLTLALTSAASIGCNIVNIGGDDLHMGKPHLVLGLLWQIIRIGLLADINLQNHPGLACLLLDGESLEDMMKLSPEQLLIRWVNYHLSNSAAAPRTISNLTGDIKDSVPYIHLLQQIAPKEAGVMTHCENEADPMQRAERMLEEADKIGCRQFVSAKDVTDGIYKLNLAFVANLFNMYPALEKPDDVDFEDIKQESREEKTYRNWMNSLGVSPYVNHLYSDLTDGVVIFQLYDYIKPGIVDWKRVHKNFKKMRMMMEKIENCNYAVELGKQNNFSLVGIDGKDLYDGNETLTLALVWQLMRAYTLSILNKLASGDDDSLRIADKEIVSWVNDTLKTNNKKSAITSFSDPTISDGKVVIDLVDCIKKNSVNYDLVKPGNTDQEKMDNAKYAISMSRKLGARVYALPEDIVEVNKKMVLTLFACLMIKGYQPPQRTTTNGDA